MFRRAVLPALYRYTGCAFYPTLLIAESKKDSGLCRIQRNKVGGTRKHREGRRGALGDLNYHRFGTRLSGVNTDRRDWIGFAQTQCHGQTCVACIGRCGDCGG